MIIESVTLDMRSFQFLRLPSDKPGDRMPEVDLSDETDLEKGEDERYIRCRQCHQVITKPSERIEIFGSHQHTFANPQGIVFNIGCFSGCTGCGYIGPATEEFTWFRGFSWRVAICSMCLTHLGWLFASKGNRYFNGLIMDRLIGP